MDAVNKTLYIPLYGKACVSRLGIILKDVKAEEIWDREGFPLRGKAASKWLGYYMGMRSAVFDRWVTKMRKELPGAAVLHLGCGLDSRALRVGTGAGCWYDVDFPQVIRERERYYCSGEGYRMIGSDIRRHDWMEQVAEKEAVVVMEGISMYLRREELEALLRELNARFGKVCILMDVYSGLAARMSRYKNPINQVGVTEVFGVDDPGELAKSTGLSFLAEHEMTPEDLIEQLGKGERMVFRKLYAGKTANKLYRMYEFRG